MRYNALSTADISFGNLSITLVRANARALLARCAGLKDGPGHDFFE